MIKKIKMEVLYCTPRRVTRFLLFIVFTLVVLNLMGIFLEFGLGYPTAMGFNETFDLDTEKNIPSFYSALAIFLCAIMLWHISHLKKEQERKRFLYWKMFAGIFLFLALDEFYSIHERFDKLGKLIIKNVFGESLLEIQHYGWYVPVLGFFIIISLFFIRFFFQLPKKTRFRFFIAGLIFITGAVGMEVIAGMYVKATNVKSIDGLSYALMYTGEEFLEMLGIVLFISALLKYELLGQNREIKVLWHIREDNYVQKEDVQRMEPKKIRKRLVNE